MIEPCLNFNIRKANRVLNKIYDAYLQECGLKIGQYTILRIINLLKQTTNKELQELMIVDQTTLTRSLKPLIRDGYIEVNLGEDMRVKLLTLSSSGRKVLGQARKQWRKAQDSVKDRLGPESLSHLLTVTDSIAELQTQI